MGIDTKLAEFILVNSIYPKGKLKLAQFAVNSDKYYESIQNKFSRWPRLFQRTNLYNPVLAACHSQEEYNSYIERIVIRTLMKRNSREAKELQLLQKFYGGCKVDVLPIIFSPIELSTETTRNGGFLARGIVYGPTGKLMEMFLKGVVDYNLADEETRTEKCFSLVARYDFPKKITSPLNIIPPITTHFSSSETYPNGINILTFPFIGQPITDRLYQKQHQLIGRELVYLESLSQKVKEGAISEQELIISIQNANRRLDESIYEKAKENLEKLVSPWIETSINLEMFKDGRLFVPGIKERMAYTYLVGKACSRKKDYSLEAITNILSAIKNNLQINDNKLKFYSIKLHSKIFRDLQNSKRMPLHADPHLGNVLIDGKGSIFNVDVRMSDSVLAAAVSGTVQAGLKLPQIYEIENYLLERGKLVGESLGFKESQNFDGESARKLRAFTALSLMAIFLKRSENNAIIQRKKERYQNGANMAYTLFVNTLDQLGEREILELTEEIFNKKFEKIDSERCNLSIHQTVPPMFSGITAANTLQNWDLEEGLDKILIEEESGLEDFYKSEF